MAGLEDLIPRDDAQMSVIWWYFEGSRIRLLPSL
jgi:hypothetical protein